MSRNDEWAFWDETVASETFSATLTIPPGITVATVFCTLDTGQPWPSQADADRESPEFAKPKAPLAEWMKKVDEIVKESK